MKRITLTTPDSEAEVYPYGAHVTKYEKKGQPPVLFMSEKSLFTPGKAIRGGIPVIFPWFGNHPDDPKKSAHGFARTTEWKVVSQDPNRVVLRLESDDKTRALWPHDFVADLTVTLDAKLTVALDVQNKSKQPFRYEEALHTYLTIGDIQKASVRGLENTTWIDKTDGMKRKQHGNEPVTVSKETDSVFLNTTAACTLDDPVLRREIVVGKSGSTSTVVWNPHSAKAKALSDFGDDEWQRMICIETCNVGENAVTLAPGAKHSMKTVLSSRA